jgi:hypothetical protein
LDSATPVLEFQYTPPRFALFDFRAWNNNSDVLLDMTTYVDRSPVVLPAHLLHATSGWQVEVPPEAPR